MAQQAQQAQQLEEVLRGKLEALKKEDKRLEEELQALEEQKRQFVREIKRFNDEGDSQFRTASTLHKRQGTRPHSLPPPFLTRPHSLPPPFAGMCCCGCWERAASARFSMRWTWSA